MLRTRVPQGGAGAHLLWVSRVCAASLLALGLTGCQQDPSEASSDDDTSEASGSEAEASSESGEAEAGTDTGGEAGSSEDTGESGEDSDSGTTGTSPDWSFGDHYGLPNIDDDDGNGNIDWFDAPNASDDDPRDMVIGAAKFDGFAADDRVRLRLAGATSQVRLWHGGSPVLGDEGNPAPLTEYIFTPSGGDETFTIEFAAFLDEATLTLEHIDGSDQVIDSDTLRLLASPLILNHHLQTAEHVYMTSMGNSNADMVDGYASALGAAFTAVPGNLVMYDQWMQDEPEFATATAPGGRRLDTVIDSIRNRGLDAFPEYYFGDEPSWFIGTWGTGPKSTLDSFGNLEISPPVTVGGVEYPFGRIYYGGGMDQGMVAFLESQKIQDPIEIDTSWLCVQHVDEFMTTVADPTSAKGFKVLFADTVSGYALLDAMNGSQSLPRFGADYNYPSVQSMQTDGGLRMHNDDVQIDVLNPLKAQLMAELGLVEEDFIYIPTIFEELNFGSCSGKSVALIPGTVNLIVGNLESGSPTLFVPDPFMRGSGEGVSSDAFANDFVARMPDGWDVTFLDNWDTYHVALGEVHCGTNVIRTPAANWWEVGLHLLE